MKFLAVIQARLTSQRLPQKVIRPIGELPLFLHITYRLQKISFPFVFAIPEGKTNEPLARLLSKNNIPFVLGDEENVFSRYVKAINDLQADDYVIRLTADNPFTDHCALELMQKLVSCRLPDYAHFRGLPLGMGFEMFKKKALLQQQENNMQHCHLEHVTLWIREHSGDFDFYAPELFTSVPSLRMTIDEEMDFQQAQDVYEYFRQEKNPLFTAQDIYKLYRKNPHMLLQNSHVEQKKA